MASPKTILLAGAAVVLALAGCNEAIGGMAVGAPYELRTINGQPLPVPAPGVAGAPSQLPVITEGSVTFSSAGKVERQERTVSSAATTGWTQSGTYVQQPGRVVISYDGPLAAAETLLVTGTGALTLVENGTVRVFCPGATAC